ncbi:MAG TPA: hypothetical protein VLW52_11510, partial [Opitutaceae bacterium]|nr:hypothetical protein [Opitutaceae bacterium]
LAAAAGDAADTQAQLEAWRARDEEYSNLTSAGSLDRHKRHSRFLLCAAGLRDLLHDWPAIARLGRDALDEIETALREDPEDGELLYFRSLARGLIGLALMREGKTAEAGAVLPEVLGVVRGDPPMPFTGWNDILWWAYHPVSEACVDWLAQNGAVTQARSQLEKDLGARAAQGGEDPGLNYYKRGMIAEGQLRLVELLDPTKPADAALRIKLLDHVASVLSSSEAEGRVTVYYREAKAKLEALRTVAATASGR